MPAAKSYRNALLRNARLATAAGSNRRSGTIPEDTLNKFPQAIFELQRNVSSAS